MNNGDLLTAQRFANHFGRFKTTQAFFFCLKSNVHPWRSFFWATDVWTNAKMHSWIIFYIHWKQFMIVLSNSAAEVVKSSIYVRLVLLPTSCGFKLDGFWLAGVFSILSSTCKPNPSHTHHWSTSVLNFINILCVIILTELYIKNVKIHHSPAPLSR